MLRLATGDGEDVRMEVRRLNKASRLGISVWRSDKPAKTGAEGGAARRRIGPFPSPQGALGLPAFGNYCNGHQNELSRASGCFRAWRRPLAWPEDPL